MERCLKATQGTTKTSNLIRTTSPPTEMTTMCSLPVITRTPTLALKEITRGVVTEVEVVAEGSSKIKTTGVPTIMTSNRDRDMVN